MADFMTKLTAVLTALLTLLLPLFGLEAKDGTQLDLSKFTLTFCDEFDKDEINWSVWDGHYCYGDATAVRRGGYWNRQMASLRDGNLIITTKYMSEGVNGGPAGYYSYALDTNHGRFEQTYGYFEVRCILPPGEGLWGAFWMLTDGMFTENGDGTDGAEIDVFESPNYASKEIWKRNCVSSAIHYDGYNEAHRSTALGKFYVGKDAYTAYHTYGVEWNQDGYSFYIDGKKTGGTNFGGASQVPEYLILSTEVGGSDGVPGDSWAGDITKNGTDFSSEFIIDYVRVYQYAE